MATSWIWTMTRSPLFLSPRPIRKTSWAVSTTAQDVVWSKVLVRGLFAEPVEGELYDGADLRLVVRIAALEVAVRYRAADCTGLVAKAFSHSGDSRAFHLEVCDPVLSEAERLEILKHVRHGETLSDDPALRPVEP